MKLYKIVIVILFLAIYQGFSQGGSNYSILGIGDLQQSLGAYYEGLGTTAIAVPNESEINLYNPALWSRVTSTRLQAGYVFNQRYVKSDQSNLYQNNAGVSSIIGVFAVDTSLGLGISYGVYPYTSANYLIENKFNIDYDGSTVYGYNIYQGKGGITMAHLGLGVNIFHNLSIGCAALGYFGTLTRATTTEIYTSNSTIDYNYSYDYFKGVGIKTGIYYTPVENFNLGFYFDKPLSLSADREVKLVQSYIDDSTYSKTQNVSLPVSLGFGASYIRGRYMFAADYVMQDFSDFDYRLGDSRAVYGKSSKISVGFSKMGSKTKYAKGFSRVTWNVGLYMKDLYYTVNDKKIKEFAATFGFSAPIVDKTLLDVGFTFGSRGTTSNGLLQESFARMNINVSLGDNWFNPWVIEY